MPSLSAGHIAKMQTLAFAALTLPTVSAILNSYTVPKFARSLEPAAPPPWKFDEAVASVGQGAETPLTERLDGVGITEPFPEGFDPLGLAKRADAGEMVKYREAELKHGRIAMLAVPGFLLSEDFHPLFPGLPRGEFSIFASQETWEQPAYLPLLLATLIEVAIVESRTFKGWEAPTAWSSAYKAPESGSVGVSGKMKADYTPGATLPTGPWTADKLSPEAFRAKQNAELNNGRLAMVSIALIVLQELITHVPAEEMDLLQMGLL